MRSRRRAVHTTGGVQSFATSFTFEVLRFLMGDQELQILKVSLAWEVLAKDNNPINHNQSRQGLRTVVAPRPGQKLFNVRVSALLLAHCCDLLLFGLLSRYLIDSSLGNRVFAQSAAEKSSSVDVWNWRMELKQVAQLTALPKCSTSRCARQPAARLR